jgi:hypothetical protein
MNCFVNLPPIQIPRKSQMEQIYSKCKTIKFGRSGIFDQYLPYDSFLNFVTLDLNKDTYKSHMKA